LVADGSELLARALRAGTVLVGDDNDGRSAPAGGPRADPAAVGAYEALLHGVRHRFAAHRDAPAVLASFLSARRGSDVGGRHVLTATGATAGTQLVPWVPSAEPDGLVYPADLVGAPGVMRSPPVAVTGGDRIRSW
jgi:hypothetical protein